MTQEILISELRRDERNPRSMPEIQRKRLRDSIEAFGFVDPIIVRRSDKLLIGGHQRLTAAEELGLKQVPVVWWEGDDRQARALNLALNQIEGEWEETKLATVLAELAGVESLEQTLRSFDTSLTGLAGFDSKQVLKTLAAGLKSQSAAEDLASLASRDPGRSDTPALAKAGDLFHLGAHRLLCGDSSDVGALKRLCHDDRPSLLFSDPRYNASYSADAASGRNPFGRTSGRKARPLGEIANDQLSATDFGGFVSCVLRNAVTVLEPAASVYLCGGTSTTAAYDAAFESAGLVKASVIVWDKIDFTVGRRDYQSQFELLYYGWPKGRRHRFFGGRSQSDIWTIPRDAAASYLHSTQKPVALAARAMRNSTLPGEAVLDMFGGSGSTLIAAQQSGRRAFLMELEPRFVDVAIARWQALTGDRARLVEGGHRA